MVKYYICLKTHLQQDISEPVFYGDLAFEFLRIVGMLYLNDQFKKIIKHMKEWDTIWISCDSIRYKPNYGL